MSAEASVFEPTIAEASRRLQAMIDAARGEAPELVDPRTLPVRFTRLKTFAMSPAHYLLSCQGGREETIAMRMGSGFHAAVFGNREVVCYEGIRRGKAWEAFDRDARDRMAVVLNEKEYAIARGMIDAILRHDRAMELLFDGATTEFRIDWAIGTRLCQSTPDSFSFGKRCVDLKSTRCAEPRWFAREALKRHYHAQLSFYEDAIMTFGGSSDVRPADSFLVAVENAPPFNVTIVRIPDETREAGSRICRSWWEQLTLAEDVGSYRGYVEHDVDLVIPEEFVPVEVEIDGELITVD